MGPWRLSSPCCENHFNDNGSAPGRCNPLSCEKHFTSANIHNSAMFQEIELWVISWIFESCLINTGFCLSRASPLSLWAVYTVHVTLYTVHCTCYTVHCTLYTAHCTLHTAHCTLYTVHCPAQIHNIKLVTKKYLDTDCSHGSWKLVSCYDCKKPL